MSQTVTTQTTTTMYTFQNAKGNVIAQNVRAANATEARYRAGIPQSATEVPTGSVTTTNETEYVSKDSQGHRQ